MSVVPDRIVALLNQSRVTGIDFIYVHLSQTMLDVHFLKDVAAVIPPLPGSIAESDIHIYSTHSELPRIEVMAISWVVLAGETVLRINTKTPGDFSLYKIKIDDARIDAYFNDVTFSFKANCPSESDCKPPSKDCPTEDFVDFPIDYQARDFWSYRRALLDFASVRYPNWSDRLEADAGIMMVEVMSALADEMAYYQDRVAREAYLETATQRRSIRRQVRLMDYHLQDAVGARVWLDCKVAAGTHNLSAGTSVFAQSTLKAQPVFFEVGKSITEQISGKNYGLNSLNNRLSPHIWDEDAICLPAGSTGMYLQGHQSANLQFDDFLTLADGSISAGKWVLLRTDPINAAQPVRAQMVRLVQIVDSRDEVLNVNITWIAWEPAQKLDFDFDLTCLSIKANMVPAVAGITRSAVFVINKNDNELSLAQKLDLENLQAANTIQRRGNSGQLDSLFSLEGSQTEPLVHIGTNPENLVPEIVLQELSFMGGNWVPAGKYWIYKRSFVGVNSSESQDNHFTLDDGTWQRIVGYRRIANEIVHQDYAMNAGCTIRFGNGEFGKMPPQNTVFRVQYRLGAGAYTNVAANTIQQIGSPLPFLLQVNNPLPAKGGLDAETPNAIRQVATESFKALTYRAVKPEDYAEAAERLPWVQKSGASFRWTGSWLTAFVTADPRGKVTKTPTENQELIDQLDRFRQAGRPVEVTEPDYANLDIELEICVAESSYPAQVKDQVVKALFGTTGYRPVAGYFSPDRFTFGTPLHRSSLEAAIQQVEGVKAVEKIRFRRRGWFSWKLFSEYSYDPGKNTIIRIQNDPLHPEWGKLKISTHGGL